MVVALQPIIVNRERIIMFSFDYRQLTEQQLRATCGVLLLTT